MHVLNKYRGESQGDPLILMVMKLSCVLMNKAKQSKG